jgi:hypothetical protein
MCKALDFLWAFLIHAPTRYPILTLYAYNQSLSLSYATKGPEGAFAFDLGATEAWAPFNAARVLLENMPVSSASSFST